MNPPTLRLKPSALFLATGLLLTTTCSAAPARKPTPSAKPAAAPVKPATPKPAPPVVISSSTLGKVLKELGYHAEAEDGVHRLKVEEPDQQYGYFIHLTVSKSGEWLVATAHLAPVPDLTKVPATPLLALLTQNDDLVGMAFAYQRAEGRVVLNATLPLRGLEPASIRNLVDAMKVTVRRTEGYWDPSRW